jgi:hypothetical protein
VAVVAQIRLSSSIDISVKNQHVNNYLISTIAK